MKDLVFTDAPCAFVGKNYPGNGAVSVLNKYIPLVDGDYTSMAILAPEAVTLVFGTVLTKGTAIINVAGDLAVTTVGKGLQIKEGSNAKQGVATLVAGSKIVANTSVTANSRILLTSNADGGTPGWLRVSARTAGTSFTITSSNGADTSVVAYTIIEPA